MPTKMEIRIQELEPKVPEVIKSLENTDDSENSLFDLKLCLKLNFKEKMTKLNI